MDNQSLKITLADARKIASNIAKLDVPIDFSEAAGTLLEDAYVEAEYCWIFFRNKAIVLPAERALSDFAYCVSKKGTARSIPDYSSDSVRLKEYLAIISNYFEQRGL